MATIPGHLNYNPSDFQQARQGGASAGLQVASGRRAGAAQAFHEQESAARMQQEAITANARIQQAQAALTQQQIIAEMEAKTRKEIAEQNHLKQQQQLEVQKAYQNSRIGLEQQRIKQAEAVAGAKARDAAMRFSAQQNFSQRMAAGEPVDKALYANPALVTPSTIASVTSATRPSPATVSPETKVRDQRLQKDIDEIVLKLRDSRHILNAQKRAALEQDRNAKEQQRIDLATGKTSTGTSGNEAVRFTKDGKKAVFNADTKEFLRYAD